MHLYWHLKILDGIETGNTVDAERTVDWSIKETESVPVDVSPYRADTYLIFTFGDSAIMACIISSVIRRIPPTSSLKLASRTGAANAKSRDPIMPKSTFSQSNSVGISNADQRNLLGAERYQALQGFRESECARIQEEVTRAREARQRQAALRQRREQQFGRLLQVLHALFDQGIALSADPQIELAINMLEQVTRPSSNGNGEAEKPTFHESPDN